MSSARHVLLAASAGGHLQQLWQLWPRLKAGGLDAQPLWLTFDTPQSRSLLAGESVETIPYIAPKDVVGVTRGLVACQRIFSRYRIETAISTGSAIALAALPPAALKRADCHYIESAARAAGPSLTGRLVAQIPGIKPYSQYRRWSGARWAYRGSVFDEFSAATSAEPRPIGRIVITLGTIPFRFDRAIDALRQVIPATTEVFWQLGPMRRNDMPYAHGTVPHSQLQDKLAAADVVIAHAGTGSALAALDAGHVPLLLPRRRDHGEHTDDHQRELVAELVDRNLAIGATPETLRWSDVQRAARMTVQRRSGAPITLDRR